MTNGKIIVYEIEDITAGARHYWLRTSVGRIRKPIGSLDLEAYDFDHMEEKVILLESKLLHWGRWLARTTGMGLGYPSQSTLVTALQGSKSTASPHIPDDQDAEEINRAVQKLDVDNKRWADVLRRHYTRDLDTAADKVAVSMELPKRTYFYYLNMARKKIKFFLKRN